MSEIYDYVYSHTMRPQEEEGGCNTFSAVPEALNSECEINTADFTDRDLQMFVDSLEAIARLEQAKRVKKQKRKCKKPVPKRQVTCLDSSTCSSLHDEDDTSSSGFSEMSSSLEYLYDETYCGYDAAGQSTAVYSNMSANSSDSEDSGVYENSSTTGSQLYENFESSSCSVPSSEHECENHLYENYNASASPSSSSSLSENSELYSKKKKTLKYRLLTLIKQKRSERPQMSSTKINEPIEDVAIYDRVIDEALNQHLSKKSKKSKFLTKAMRLLTL